MKSCKRLTQLFVLLVLATLSNSEIIGLLGAEEPYRSFVEQQNLEMIRAENQKAASFELGPNKFIKLTSAEFSELLGAKAQSYPEVSVVPMIGAIYKLSAQTSIDWRNSGKVSRVRNQGSACNSCYAFLAVADIETSYLLASKNIQLSPQQIIDCTSSYGNNGCTNGFYGYAFEYAKNNPLSTESAYPYTGKVQVCRQSSEGYKISSYLAYNGNSCSFLKNMLQMRPVSVSVDGTNFYWQFYRRGVLSSCGINNRLNHGVQVVGMDSDASGSWWIAKNSWGAEWGEGGYIRLDRTVNGGNICLICSFIYHSLL